jgi:ABC-2 type transport system ATP-binding protein
MSSILTCKKLTKKYGFKTALNEIDLELDSGKIIGLLGPNGSGKTTLIKLINGLITPSSGELQIKGNKPSVQTKKIVSYLPERTYFNDYMTVEEIISMFQDFYEDFRIEKAREMLSSLGIETKERLKTLSKGTKEKIQLILVMSREADLYVLDEPIAGVDPAARDYILKTIITNYREESTILISTHLISDIENVLDEIIFIKDGNITLHSSVDDIRSKEGKSVDTLFREVFAC